MRHTAHRARAVARVGYSRGSGAEQLFACALCVGIAVDGAAIGDVEEEFDACGSRPKFGAGRFLSHNIYAAERGAGAGVEGGNHGQAANAAERDGAAGVRGIGSSIWDGSGRDGEEEGRDGDLVKRIS